MRRLSGKDFFTKNLLTKVTALATSVILSASVLTGCGIGKTSEDVDYSQPVEITNVSYDPTRELYASYNELFEKHWKELHGQDVTIVQSHGGSGKQALEVANGLEADVVTLALEGDVDTIKDAGIIEPGYTSEFDLDSSPYTSTIVFLVRKGNPKNIQDWDDLLKNGVGVITPNPKTSGGARWNYLAAWYYFEKKGKSESQIQESIKKLYKNVLVLDSGARGSTTTPTWRSSLSATSRNGVFHPDCICTMSVIRHRPQRFWKTLTFLWGRPEPQTALPEPPEMW